MATWKGAPTPATTVATGSGRGLGLYSTGALAPSAQNSPYTGQPGWIGAPHGTSFLNPTTGQTV